MSIQQEYRHNPRHPGSAVWMPTLADVEAAIHRSATICFLSSIPRGIWCGELEADSMLEADYIFLHTLLEYRRSRSGSARPALR